jgi:hypothetical protein
MKNFRSMANRRAAVISLLASILILSAAPNGDGRRSAVSETGVRHGRTASGYVYMNGGTSADEQFSMERRAAPYNVKLVLVPPLALPLSRLRVFIANNRTGKIEMIPLSGPWLYFQLPAGSYTIGARIRNRLYVLRDVQVQNAGRQTHVLRADLLPSGVNQPKNNGGIR